jgi:phosphocarrier protein
VTEAAVARADVKIANQRGLHARAAARFVQTAEQFDAEVAVSKDDSTVPGTSILGLMMLAASPGTVIHLEAAGPERVAAIDALVALIENRFGED